MQSRGDERREPPESDYLDMSRGAGAGVGAVSSSDGAVGGVEAQGVGVVGEVRRRVRLHKKGSVGDAEGVVPRVAVEALARDAAETLVGLGMATPMAIAAPAPALVVSPGYVGHIRAL